MKKDNRKAFLVIAMALSLGGCATAVEIVQPVDKLTSRDPVTEFVVRFDAKFAPGTFRADINGTDWTQFFSPAAAPGGMSTASAPAYFVGGEPVGRPPLFEHTLSVSGDFSPGNLGWTRDTHTFIPPTLRSDPTYLFLRETILTQVAVLMPQAPSQPVTVTVAPNNIAVSLNDQPAGQPIQVTIPTNDRRATFNVRGISRGTFALSFTAFGCQLGAVVGQIN